MMSAVGEGFDFTHDRIRRVVYDAVLEPRRRTLHAAVGEALESLHADDLAQVHADRLAHHYRQAGVADKAVTYLVLVGETARARYALDDALRAFDEALALVDRLSSSVRESQRFDVLLRKALDPLDARAVSGHPGAPAAGDQPRRREKKEGNPAPTTSAWRSRTPISDIDERRAKRPSGPSRPRIELEMRLSWGRATTCWPSTPTGRVRRPRGPSMPAGRSGSWRRPRAEIGLDSRTWR